MNYGKTFIWQNMPVRIAPKTYYQKKKKKKTKKKKNPKQNIKWFLGAKFHAHLTSLVTPLM